MDTMAGLSYRATYLFLFHFIMDWENVEIEHELEMSKAYRRDWAKHHGIHLDSAFSRASPSYVGAAICCTCRCRTAPGGPWRQHAKRILRHHVCVLFVLPGAMNMRRKRRPLQRLLTLANVPCSHMVFNVKWAPSAVVEDEKAVVVTSEVAVLPYDFYCEVDTKCSCGGRECRCSDF